MRLYFGGSEIGSHRTLLEDEGVQNVSMSYMGLRRRVKFAKPWLIADKFPSYMNIFLDSGVYTLNNAKPPVDDTAHKVEIEEIWDHYQDFVNANLDRVDLVSEFDAMHMGLDWIEEQREIFWNKIPQEKFLAIWHPVWGVPYLNEMASRYEVIGIPSTSLEGRDLRPVLNRLVAGGTRIHGVAMTKVDEMQSIRWSSVASTSWISPQRFGDTIVWTGNELKRYPMKYKEIARKRHRTLFTQMGLDAEKISADDSTEVLRLSVRSWLKYEEYVNRRHKNDRGVTTPDDLAEDETVENPEDVVDPLAEGADNSVPTEPDAEPTREVEKRTNSGAVANPRAVSLSLPVMGLQRLKEDDEDSPEVLRIRSESSRVCDTCFLAEKCPMFEEGSNCAYNIPVTLRTREQRKALHEGLLEMQTQRVMFMRFAEEAEGGYADPNLTKEMNLLNKMMADYAELEREGFSITVSGRGAAGPQAEGGMISRMFGDRAGQKVQELETGPTSADAYIIDAEIVSEEEK